MNAFKSERPRISKPRFASQVDEKIVLLKPVTPYYLPKVREYVRAKPHHMNAPGSSRNSQEESYSSNDMAHNHDLEEARKKAQETNRNSKPSVMPSVRLQNTANEVEITGKIFTTLGLKWIPTGKLFDSCTSKVDSEPPNGSNDDITNPYECDQTLNVSAGLSLQRQMAFADNTSGPALQRKEKCTIQCALSSKEEKSSHPSDTYVFTMKMEILLEPTSNKLMVGKLGDSDVHTLEDLTLILEILSRRFFLRLNLPDHRSVLTGSGVQVKMEMQIPRSSRVKFIATCSYSRLNDFITSRKNDPKLPQTLISTSSSVCQNDEVMN
ncbi:hypothetical protein Tco_0009544 [Tanacetum coccineum]